METKSKNHDSLTSKTNRTEVVREKEGICCPQQKDSLKSYLKSVLPSWSFTWIMYSIFISSCLRLATGYTVIYSSPLLDEIIRNANSTPWVDGFGNCIYQSMIAPSLFIGNVVGSIMSAFVASLLGLASSMILSTGIYAIGWAMIGVSWFTPSPVPFRAFIFSGSIVTGINSGLVAALQPVYVGEMSPSSKHRVAFVGFGFLMYGLGTMTGYLFGYFFSYWICAFIYGGMMVAIIPFQFLASESPLRTHNVINNVKKMPNALKNRKDAISRGFALCPFVKRLALANLVFFCRVFMGYFALIQYVGPILNVAGASEWNIPHGVLIALTVGLGDLIGAILSILTAPRIDHVVSAFIGSVGICLGHVGIAVYFILVGELGETPVEEIAGGNMTNLSSGLICFFKLTISSELGQKYSPLALISIVIVMVMYGAFWKTQPFVITVELFANETRDLGMGITITVKCFLQIFLSFLFPYVQNYLGTGNSFFILAANAALAAILIPCLVPETKGRMLGERGDKFTPKQNLLEFLNSLKSLFCFCWRKH